MTASVQAENPHAGTGRTTSRTDFSRGRTLRPTEKVLPEHARRHNRSLVLQTIYRFGAMSRADIARDTGLTRVTVSDLVAELIHERLVVEKGQREDSRPGKPAMIIDIDRDAYSIIGIDLSDHESFRGAVMNLDGDIHDRIEIALDGSTGVEAMSKVTALAQQLVALASTDVLGIGIGSPGIVSKAGVVVSAPNLGWSDLPMGAIVASATELPVVVSNDANAAVLAEHGFGGADDDFVLVRIGHGVGAGMLVDGAVLFGARSTAGEIGHITVGTDGGPRCACGKTACLEAWLAAPRLAEALGALPHDADGEERQRHRDAVLRAGGTRLGVALAPVVGALGVIDVVLSGDEALLDDVLRQATIETLRSRIVADIHGSVSLRMTTLGKDIVLRGAAVMVLSAQLGVS